VSERLEINIERLRDAWITYRSVAWSWFDVNDEDGNDGEDFDVWLEAVKQAAFDDGFDTGNE
jgi:hypothetical protein